MMLVTIKDRGNLCSCKGFVVPEERTPSTEKATAAEMEMWEATELWRSLGYLREVVLAWSLRGANNQKRRMPEQPSSLAQDLRSAAREQHERNERTYTPMNCVNTALTLCTLVVLTRVPTLPCGIPGEFAFICIIFVKTIRDEQG